MAGQLGERILLRLPGSVLEELQEIAGREHNGVAAVVRRLLAVGIAIERRGRVDVDGRR